MSGEENKIISFQLLKVEKGREKICRCNPPHYEIDTVNHIVSCTDCGATVEPFEALVEMAEHAEKYAEFQRKAIDNAKTYQEYADKEFRRYIREKSIKEMDRNFRNGLLPVCPKCRKLIDPTKIKEYSNKRFLENEESKND